MRCCCNSCKLSIEKAEKVVKPPHKPVTENNFQLVSKVALRSEMANTIPITKQPILLPKM